MKGPELVLPLIGMNAFEVSEDDLPVERMVMVDAGVFDDSVGDGLDGGRRR